MLERSVAGATAACFVCLLAAAAAAQDGALYPAVDLPLPSGTSAATAGEGEDALARPVPVHSGAAPGALDVPFDASHFTPSPVLAVRDLDGNGHLDGLWLHGGVHAWFGQGDGRFADAAFQPTQLGATSTLDGQWADMNGDGRLDAVFLTYDQVEVFFDQGDGSFVSSMPQPVPGANFFNFHAWALGFVNGDAFNDIVVRNVDGGAGYELDILYGAGGASFGAPVKLGGQQGFADAFGLGDLDGNGLTDVFAVLGNATPAKLRTWTQTAAGSFTTHPAINLTGNGASRIEVRDMTGDGLADVVVHEFTTVSLYVGDGTASLPATAIVLPGVLDGALFVDLDEDGLVDVLQADQEKPLGPSVEFARADGSLSPPVITRHRATPLGAGDFDGDGLLDLFSPEAALRGRGDGSFEAPRNFALGLSISLPRQVVLDDFNEDGQLDVFSLGDTNGAYATMSDVAATWGPPVSVDVTVPGSCGAAGDLNGDGHQDVIASHAAAGGTHLWLGRGDGTFLEKPSPFMGGQTGNTGLGVGRFDANAPLDLVAASDGQLRVRLGLGALAFGDLKPVSLPASAGQAALTVRDLDGDGLDDVIVAQSAGVLTLHATGHGNFDAPVPVSGPVPQLAGVSLADVDADTDDDLLVSAGFTVSVLLGDGAGHFAPAPFGAVTSDRLVIGTAVADVNGDGLPDLALGHYQAWSLHLGVAAGGWEPEPVDVFDLPGEGVVLRFQDLNVDGRPDLMAIGGEGIGSSSDGIGLTLAVQRTGPWTDAGFALAGASGTPFLWPTGTLQAHDPVTLVLRDAAANAPTCFVLGLSERVVPFKGGVLVPAPLLVLPCPPASSEGVTTLGATWPAGVPSGTQLWVQTWIPDASGPAGFSASNAVTGTAP